MAVQYSNVAGNNTVWRLNVGWTFAPSAPTLTANKNYTASITWFQVATPSTSAASTGTFYINNIYGYRTGSNSTAYGQTVPIKFISTWNNASSVCYYFNTSQAQWKYSNGSAITKTFSGQSSGTGKVLFVNPQGHNVQFNHTINTGVSLATTYSKDNSTWQASPQFTGLTANTAYTFYIRTIATSASGNTATKYANVPVRTIASVVSNPAVTVSNITQTTAQVNVSATGADNAPVTSYKLSYGKVGAGTMKSVDLGTSTSTTLSNLDPNSQYKAVLTVYNAEGAEYATLLPSAYTEKTYVHFDKNGYINTGYLPGPHTKIEVRYVLGSTSSDYYQQRIFGTLAGSGSLNFDHYLNGAGILAWADQDNEGNWQTTERYGSAGTWFSFILDNYGSTAKLNTNYSATISTTRTLTATQPIYLGGAANGSGGVSTQHLLFGNIGRVAIYEYGTLQRLFIPAVRNSDSAPGFYEIVTEQFFTNAQSGTLTVGDTRASDGKYFTTLPDTSNKIWYKGGTILPTGYTQVDYLQTDGNQYVNTSFNPSGTTGIEIGLSNTTKGVLFGAYNSTWTNGYGMYVNPGDNFYYHYLCNTKIDFVPPTEYDIVFKNGQTIINGVTKASISAQTFTVNYPLYLLAGNMGGSVEQPVTGRIYYAKIYNGNTLSRNYIPCYRNSDNKPGLYDLVTGVFFSNAGTGEFTLGPVTQWHEGTVYIKRNGTWTIGKQVYVKRNGEWVEGIAA